jgi:hypothetical protein
VRAPSSRRVETNRKNHKVRRASILPSRPHISIAVARSGGQGRCSINRNSAVASGSTFFNGWRSTLGTAPPTSQLALLISTTTTNDWIKRGQASAEIIELGHGAISISSYGR